MALAQGEKQFGNRRPGGVAAPPVRTAKSGARVGASMTDVFDEQNRTRLMIIGGAVAAVLLVGWAYFSLLSAESIDGKVLRSPDECASFGSAKIDDCTELWRQGLIQHANTAPAYETSEACERNHGAGRCALASRSTIANRQNKFIPAMMAIMPVASANGWAVTPLYRNPGDGPDQWRQTLP
ncbi:MULTISPECIES: DUF1190 domain-containing protein [unclassified Beijerinckia]|uniref:DUF1190 domain-containing protein n=1 Tax=unclassified Beijerinckia TaxID=2638183 RepID=UPI001114F9F3|nr:MULTISPECIES: DUF1190 domain-containing protein [unclassified Beijerinckia]